MSDTIRNAIKDCLPESADNPNYRVDYTDAIERQMKEERRALSASDLARIRLRERNALGRRKKGSEEAQAAETAIEEVKAVEASPEAQDFLAGGPNDMEPYAGTRPRDVVKLLSSLNINTSLYLTRADTYNLLSCLLTCNEGQLSAIYQNPKVPLAIKTVIKRLMEDARTGNIDTLERLWDRVFGKGVAAADIQLPEGADAAHGLIPHTLVSREAYMIIRETVLGGPAK